MLENSNLEETNKKLLSANSNLEISINRNLNSVKPSKSLKKFTGHTKSANK